MTHTLPHPVDAAELDHRVGDLPGRLILRGKAQLLSGKDIWNTMELPGRQNELISAVAAEANFLSSNL